MGNRHNPPDNDGWPDWLNTRAMRRYLEHRLAGSTLKKSDGERLIMNAQARTLGLMTREGFLTPAGFRFLGKPSGLVCTLADRDRDTDTDDGRRRRAMAAGGADCAPWEPDRLGEDIFREILGSA